ncbi:MAG: hypothetical protein ACM30F_02810 [Nitrospirota bacterium]
MKKLLSIILTASLLLYPFATFAVDYGSQPSQTQQVPPVAQTLVREGDFAVKLAATLNVGLPTNEAEAEDMLAKAGVAPLNGWISDYPMTPQIVGQIQDSITKAAAERKLPMNSEEATKGLYLLTAQMKLPTPAGEGTTAPDGKKAPVEPYDSQTINNYYSDEGPPIVTYYPPPVYYGYLYDWVPYPVFWFGFWFPGFFICHNFTTTVIVSNPPFVNRKAIVSNNVINRDGRRVAVVDPVVRTNTGGVRPVTTLRTESGRTFRNLADLRNAEAIYLRSVERMQAGTVREGGMVRGAEGRSVEPGAPDRTFNGPVRGGSERRFVAPNGSSESIMRFSAPSGSSMGNGRQLVAPSAPSRSFSGSMSRGGNHPTRSFSGSGGWRGR